jgi:alpha-tubulin suppressor-like RCC1 family protein
MIGHEKAHLPEKDAASDDAGPDEQTEGEEGCVDNWDCDDGKPCTDDRCDPATHRCMHLLKSGGTSCRAAAGDCDVEEFCDGSSGECPPDTYEPPAHSCRPAADTCDEPEFCTGGSATCPGNSFTDGGTPCDDGDDCTYADACDGAGGCVGTRGLHDVVEISTSTLYEHVCAVLTGGEIFCWGDDRFGQLGDGRTATMSTLPVAVQNLPGEMFAVSAGGNHTCAVLHTGGETWCWGLNENGQLGIGSVESQTTPMKVEFPEPGIGADEIAAGFHYTCALMRPGGVYCWGYNRQGQGGNVSLVDQHAPYHVPGLEIGVTRLSAAIVHTCAVQDGGVKCWGNNVAGQLGDGTYEAKVSPPASVTGLAAPALSVSCGENFSCAVLDTGAVACWGGNDNGQLGTAPDEGSPVPVEVEGLSGVRSIDAGSQQACALLEDGGVVCWGQGHLGQLGNGSESDSAFPVDVVGLESGAAAVSCGRHFCCALLESGAVVCWGENGAGELGDGTTENRSTPVDVGCP